MKTVCTVTTYFNSDLILAGRDSAKFSSNCVHIPGGCGFITYNYKSPTLYILCTSSHPLFLLLLPPLHPLTLSHLHTCHTVHPSAVLDLPTGPIGSEQCHHASLSPPALTNHCRKLEFYSGIISFHKRVYKNFLSC